MTDPDDRFDHLRGIVADLDRASRRVKDLERERDEEILRLISRYPRSLTAAATAAGLSRQRVNSIRQLAQARLARAKHDPPDPQS